MRLIGVKGASDGWVMGVCHMVSMTKGSMKLNRMYIERFMRDHLAYVFIRASSCYANNTIRDLRDNILMNRS